MQLPKSSITCNLPSLGLGFVILKPLGGLRCVSCLPQPQVAEFKFYGLMLEYGDSESSSVGDLPLVEFRFSGHVSVHLHWCTLV